MRTINIAIGIALGTTMSGCDNTPDFDATGIFEATTVTVSAETTGKILSLPITEGDSVKAGELIAVIDTTMLELQLNQVLSQRNSAQSTTPDVSAQVAALRTRIAHQQQECDRIARLLADGAATQKQSDDAGAALATLKNELNALLSTLNKSRTATTDNVTAIGYQSDQILRQIEKSKITSPISGTILTKYAEQGEFATPGRALCKIADLNNIYLRAYFTVSQLADLRIGQEVTVIADFGGNEQYEYPGTVAWISQESEFTPKSIQTRDSRANLVYAVKITVKNDGRLKLGQYGEVRL
ncbi:MAG: HlyD family efflux transporter periplasmic adaptor subunit [Paramuribaculum sp.]|nr:HlyD family efflux transporter periplasmic adaptor subunit [Paramuribaculum sp.]